MQGLMQGCGELTDLLHCATRVSIWNVSLPGLAPSHFVFRILQTSQAFLILARLGLGPLDGSSCGDGRRVWNENIILRNYP